MLVRFHSLGLSNFDLVVFEMHFNELLQRNEEIERLKAVIEGLGTANPKH